MISKIASSLLALIVIVLLCLWLFYGEFSSVAFVLLVMLAFIGCYTIFKVASLWVSLKRYVFSEK